MVDDRTVFFWSSGLPSTKASLGVPGQVTQIHLQGIAELGLQLSQGLLVAVAGVDAGGGLGDISQGTQAPYSEYEVVDWAPGLWILNASETYSTHWRYEVSWLWGLTDVSTITHHRFELAMGGPWCWKPPAASSQEQSLFLIPSPFFQEASSFPLSVYAISPGLVDKNHPISRTSSGYTLHTWHPLLFEASGCPSRSLASQVAEHGTCHVKRTHFMQSCWDLLLGMDSYIQ
jgi:hypothetical protein